MNKIRSRQAQRGGSHALAVRTAQARLADLISDQDVNQALGTLRSALGAKMTVRARATSQDAVTYQEVEDWATRTAAARTLLEFRYGRAPQAVQFTAEPPADSFADLDPARLAQTLASLEGDLGDIAKTWLDAMKRADTVDIPDVGKPVQAEEIADIAPFDV